MPKEKEFKITPLAPQPNYIPDGVEATNPTEGFGIEDTPRVNEKPVAPNTWDDNATKGARWNVNLVDKPIGTFAGDGSDGALNATAGTTTLDLENKLVKVFNFESINVVSGATVDFKNPHSTQGTIIIFKSKGNVDILGTIDASGMGGQGGAGGSGVQGVGSDGNDSDILLDTTDHFGTASTSYGAGVSPGQGGAQIDNTATIKGYATAVNQVSYLQGNYRLAPGTGGGGGGNPEQNPVTDAGDGGDGGAAFVIECGGKWNFTGTISVAGTDGGTPTGSGSAGGGGGSGGQFLGLYNELTANTGTVTVTAGSGGGVASYNGNTGNGGDGGGGGGHIAAAGTNGTDGQANGPGGDGGAGAAGTSFIAQNVWIF